MKKIVVLLGIAVMALGLVPLAYGFVSFGPPGSYLSGTQQHITSNLQTAVNSAPNASDKTLIIMEGTYNVGYISVVDWGVNFYNGVTIMNEPGKNVTLNGWVQIFGVNNLTIKGLNIVAPSDNYTAIEIGYIVNGLQLLDDYITGSNWIAVYFSWGTITNSLIQGNVIHNAPGVVGIGSGANINVAIDSNTIYNTGAGIQTWSGPSGTITNNLIVNNPNAAIYNWPHGTATASYNCAYNSSYIEAELGAGNISVNPVFSSVNSADPNFLYLSCDTPDAVLTGASDGGFIGALPIYGSCCIEGDEALLAACKEGRALVMATEGWDQPRNAGQGKGQGVVLNMPLIAKVASDYVDTLVFCDEENTGALAEEMHSCIVSYFASGGKSSHFGE